MKVVSGLVSPTPLSVTTVPAPSPLPPLPPQNGTYSGGPVYEDRPSVGVYPLFCETFYVGLK